MDWTIFCQNIKELLNLERFNKTTYIDWNMDDKNIIINYYIDSKTIVEFSYTKIKFNREYRNFSNNNELCIINRIYCEVPISMRNDYFPIIPSKYDILDKKYNDKENNIQYEISTPSKEFMLKLIELKVKPNAIMMLRRLQIDREKIKSNEINRKDIFELLKLVYRDCITLKINSINEYAPERFQSFVDAFIYNINYNTDIGLRQTYDYNYINERRNNHRFRNEKFESVPVPKRHYKRQLLEQYNMANISEDPFIKFLCYYHILEHYYEEVYTQEIIRIVRDELTSPSFSAKRDKDIKRLIDAIKEKVKLNNEQFFGDEQEALELVIKKYVNINTLKDRISEIDNNLVEFYDKSEVTFSNGTAVNFNDVDNIYKNIAKRIYRTRNSLVHYKSNEITEKSRGIYNPFEDRKELLKEITLIRLMAEDVILSTSKII